MVRERESSSSLPSPPCPKRQKLGSDEVYIVLHAGSSYFVYIVDLSDTSDSLVQRTPVSQTMDNFPVCMAFAVVDSTLYLFGGMGDPYWHVASYSYPLSPRQSHTCQDILLSDITKVSPMICEKVFPRAVLIGDQICVFSTLLGLFGFNFELYNPDTNKWSTVPEPRIDFTDLRESAVVFDGVKYCEIKLYCVENLLLFISTVNGSYCFDFGQPGCIYDREWVPCDFPLAFPEKPRCTQPFLKDGNLLFTPFDVYDLNEQRRQPLLSFSSMRNRAFKSHFRDIFLLPKKTKEERLRACIFEAGFSYCNLDWDNNSAFGVYLVKFDDGDDGDTKKLTPTILNSKLLKLWCHIHTRDIYNVGVYPIPM